MEDAAVRRMLAALQLTAQMQLAPCMSESAVLGTFNVPPGYRAANGDGTYGAAAILGARSGL